MASPSSSRLLVSGFAFFVTGAFGLGGCQLLLNDRSGSGGTGTGTTATHGSSTSKTSSANATTGTSSTKTSSTATGTTGTGTTTTSTATGTMTATVSSSATGGGCTTGIGSCSETTPNFPVCLSGTPVTCGADMRCAAYCNSLKACNMAGYPQYESNDQCCAYCAYIDAATAGFDAGNFCCRAGALNTMPETPNSCTAGGAFGNMIGGSGSCGDQAQRVCAFAEHICSIPSANCANCESNVGTNGATYVWNSTSSPANQLMTLALTALSPNLTTHQNACMAIGNMFCN